MGTVHSLYNNDDALGVLLRAAVNAPPLPEPPHDELFNVLSGLLEEPATISDGKAPHQGTDNDIVLLREANSRLRALAIQLSNLVGDLPVPR
jgi:hypothetical protein